MTWTLEVASNAAASAWTDVTALVDRKTWKIGGECPGGGQAGTGFGFDFADDAAAYEFPARRVVRLTIGATVCGRGRVAVKDLARGMIPAGDARQYAVQFTDGNSHLQGIPVHGWSRPAETDVTRITALCADFLAGSPRASTDLATTYLSADNPVDLEAKVYDTTNPAGVVAEIERIAGKLFFVTVDDEVFYDRVDSSNYNASLSVTDVTPDLSASFPPIWDGAAATQDGSELYTGLGGVWGSEPTTIYVEDATAETDHDYWHEIVNLDSTSSDQAAAELASLLEFRKLEEDRFRFSLRLTEAQVSLIKYGQNVSFRSAAAGILSPITIRVGRLVWEEYGPGIYLARIENAKLAPRLARGDRTTTPPPGGWPVACTYETWAGGLGDWNISHSIGDAAAVAGLTTSAGVLSMSWENADNAFEVDGLKTILDTDPDFPSATGVTGLGVSFYSDLPEPIGDDNINTISFGMQWNNAGLTEGGSATVHFKVNFGDWDGVTPQVEGVNYFPSPTYDPRYFTVVSLEGPSGVLDHITWVGTDTTSIQAVGVSVGLNASDLSADLLPEGESPVTLSGTPTGTGVTTRPEGLTDGKVTLNFVFDQSTTPDPIAKRMTISAIDLSGDTPRSWCTTGVGAGAGIIQPQSVLAISDGSTTGYEVFYPYAPGTLRVLVDRIDWTNEITEVDPTAGAFAFAVAPASGDTIAVEYVRAA